MEIFIDKAKKIHGDKYNYSKVNYINNKTKIIILCDKHGEFLQRPTQHIVQEQGCPTCGVELSIEKRTLSTEKFIEQSKKIHNNVYNYDKTIITTLLRNVIITCLIHGDFTVIPKDHLKKIGCVKCNDTNIIKQSNSGVKYTIEQIISLAIEIHGYRYDYSKVVYNNMISKVIIICKVHGEFHQSMLSHIYKKRGCSICGKTKKLTNEIFINKCIIIHNNKYDYSNTIYIDTESYVNINCLVHGLFKIKAKKHISGQGCMKCVKNNASKKANDWIKYMSIKLNTEIQSSENGGEYILKTENSIYKFDGYCKKTNTCFEYYGNMYHGNPKMYSSDKPYPFIKKNIKTFGDAFNNTIKREEYIKSKGFNIICIWENEWDLFIKSIKIIQKYWRSYSKLKLIYNIS
jgi:hypothetical protein